MKKYTAATTQSPFSTVSASTAAAEILFHHHDTVASLNGIMRHPRSLARPTPTWRPPSKALPAVPGTGVGKLNATLTRHRVGARARARVLGFGEDRVPAYLITLRITDPTGYPVDTAVAEGWARSLVESALAPAIHEVTRGNVATFVWLVDSSYTPVFSPASLFEGFSQAA